MAVVFNSRNAVKDPVFQDLIKALACSLGRQFSCRNKVLHNIFVYFKIRDFPLFREIIFGAKDVLRVETIDAKARTMDFS